MSNNNQLKQKKFLPSFLKNIIRFQFLKILYVFNFYLKPVSTRGSNSVKEHKADRKNREGTDVT